MRTVLALHGRYVSIEQLRRYRGNSRDGLTAKDLLDAARDNGLEGQGLRVSSTRALDVLRQGSILHWRDAHFVVFDKHARGRIVIIDPAVGRLRLTPTEFADSYSGTAITFRQRDDFRRQKPPGSPYNRYLRAILTQRRLLVSAVAITVALRIVALASPLLIGQAVDSARSRGNIDYRYFVALASAIGMYSILVPVRGRLLLRLRTRVDRNFNEDFVGHLLRLPTLFFANRSAADIGMRFRSLSMVRDAVTAAAMSAVVDSGFILVYLGVLATFSPRLLALGAALSLCQVAILAAVRSRLHRQNSLLVQNQTTVQSYFQECLYGIRGLKVMGLEESVHREHRVLYERELTAARLRGISEVTIETTTSITRLFAPGLMLLAALAEFENGSVSLGQAVAVGGIAAGIFDPIASLITAATNFALLRGYLERVEDVFQSPPDRVATTTFSSSTFGEGITASELCFSYTRPGPRLINKISLSLDAGSSLAIVGGSGAGKSTLAHLLFGMLKPDSGRISLGGDDLESIRVADVAGGVGAVLQTVHLLGDSIRANVAFGRPDISDDDIWWALSASMLEEFVSSLPLGLNTIVGAGGSYISGGQAQRLAIARALVGRPRFLLLDEATSQLDERTEEAVLGRILELGMTTVFVTHRQKFAKFADIVIDLDSDRDSESLNEDFRLSVLP